MIVEMDRRVTTRDPMCSVSSRVRVRPVLAHDEADSSAHVLVVERLGLLEVDAVPRPRRLLVPEKKNKCETLRG